MLAVAVVALLTVHRLVDADVQSSGPTRVRALPDALSSEMQGLLGHRADQHSGQAGAGAGRRAAPAQVFSPEDFDMMTRLRPPPAPATSAPAKPTTGAGKRRRQNKKNNKRNKAAGTSKRHKSKPPGNVNSLSSYSPNYTPSYPPSYPPTYLTSYPPSYHPSYTPIFHPPNVYPPDYMAPHPHHPPFADPYAGHLYEMHLQSNGFPASPLYEPSGSGGKFQTSASAAPDPEDSSELDSHQRPSFSRPVYVQQTDARPAGSSSVQLTQSVPAGEHHSTGTGWELPHSTPTTLPPATSTAAAAAASKKATLRDILAEDCPGAEDIGYCDSPPRYPTQQVAEIIQKCSHVVEAMYAPAPEQSEDTSSMGEEACESVRRPLRPGYVRDASSGRWLVALQAVGVVQRVAAQLCSSPGRPCARLAESKCARNLGFRNGARPTACEQRAHLIPVLTWDPESPARCPRMRQARFPTGCVCRMGPVGA